MALYIEVMKTTAAVASEIMKILIELLISLLYSSVIVSLGFAFFSLAIFNFELLFFTFFMPPVAFGLAVPGLIMFGLPATLISKALNIKSRTYWISLGVAMAIPAGYVLPGEFFKRILLLAIPIGAMTGYLIQKRLYNERQYKPHKESPKK